ncbi:GntR family transcriptional regulator [Paenalcaligenes niemegkensis]|uniref:GntR family transcriptional regulator n=1 Tax=Paenalcaligenes niemegkensis TaxID=2895469 RepID=UPI001EE91D63|nr:GntR family transcriptional regulator [Paenalcaligenes niemegkensis]MCQ9618143.1 GntR family transcriptional regulator [Paenalcaligenes niemegkensis]
MSPPPVTATAFTALKHENMGALVYQTISLALIEGRLRPDERLRIRELAEEMGTSVTPVRDAILRLVQDGALTMRSARDIRVSQVTLEEYLEIRDIRLELEGMAAARAAEKATDADIQRLEALIQENEDALQAGDVVNATGLNQRFHFEYCKIADMPVLLDILRRLWLKMGPLIAEIYADGGRDMIDGHYVLIEAMRNRDGQAAKIAVQTDILSGGQPILEFKRKQAAANTSTTA